MPPRPAATGSAGANKRPAPKPTSPRKGKKGNQRAPVGSDGAVTPHAPGRMTRNSSNPVVAPIPDQPPPRILSIWLRIRHRGQVTRDHTGQNIVSKAADTTRTCSIRFSLTMSWSRFKQLVEQRVSIEVGEVCRLEDLELEVDLTQTTYGRTLWCPRTERVYKELNMLYPTMIGEHRAKGNASFTPPDLRMATPPPAPPSPPAKPRTMTSRERVATTWDSNKAIKYRILKQNPPCQLCSRSKHTDARCYVDEQHVHYPLTSHFIHHWADSIRTGESGYGINELSEHLLDRLFDMENLHPSPAASPSKDPHAARRQDAARVAIAQPRRILAEQTQVNVMRPATGSPRTPVRSSSSLSSTTTSSGPSSSLLRVPAINMSLPYMAREVLTTPYVEVISMLIKEGVYDTDVLVQWLKQLERNPHPPRSKARWELPIRAWLHRVGEAPRSHAQNRRQIIRDVREWCIEHSIAVPSDMEGCTGEEGSPEAAVDPRDIPPLGTSQSLLPDGYGASQTSVIDVLDDSQTDPVDLIRIASI
ncbi:unnamed protein product [Parajaminaea phylloscopi]